MNNRMSIPICCRNFKEFVASSEIVDYDKYARKFEIWYKRLDGWYLSDEMGNLTYPRLEFCPWCGIRLPE
jgi:hypothetical protein